MAPEIRGSRGTRHDAVSPIVVVRGVYTGVRRRFQGIRYCGRNTEQRSRLFRGLNTHTPPPVGGVYRLRAPPTTYPSTDTRYQGTLVAPRRTQRISRANSRPTIFHVLIFPPPSSTRATTTHTPPPQCVTLISFHLVKSRETVKFSRASIHSRSSCLVPPRLISFPLGLSRSRSVNFVLARSVSLCAAARGRSPVLVYITGTLGPVSPTVWVRGACWRVSAIFQPRKRADSVTRPPQARDMSEVRRCKSYSFATMRGQVEDRDALI